MNDGPSHASNFDENDYARPNQPWQCGWSAEGQACPLGPTKWGLCRSAHECSPYKVGDTWVCARTKAYGGKCDDGPLPDGTCCHRIQKCQPVRGVLARRGVLTFTVFAAAVALALIILGSPNRQHLVSPGELTSQHSQVVDRCEDCHAAAVGRPTEWIQTSFDSHAARQQSEQCLKCHTELGPNAKQPHGQASDVLAELTRLRADRSAGAPRQFNADVVAAKAFLSQPTDAGAGRACANCHREHRGTMADLNDLTNQQCQVCHVDSFHSFSNGHPEFTAYPYERRTRLYFDHLSHYGEHFAATASKQDRQCSDCHHPDTAGRYMLVKEFDATCAECHSHQIHDDTTLGIAAFALPALDVEALRKNGRKIGEWPREYPRHAEAAGTLSPLLRLLLQSDPGYAAVEASVAESDLRDLQDADSAQLQAVETLVWLVKETLYDLLREGHPEVERRLTSVLGEHIAQSRITTLANSYPLPLLGETQAAWLPSLVAEVEARRSGDEPPALEDPGNAALEEPAAIDLATVLQNERRQSAIVASGWYAHGSSLSLRYRPNGHADPLLKSLIEIGASGIVPESAATPLESTLSDLFDQVSSPFAAGRCMKCHSVDREPNTAARVNWHPYKPPLAQHKFTRFSHAPHVTLLSDEACSTCHRFDESKSAAASLFRPEFIDRRWRPALNPHQFDSDFVPLSHTGCAQCHSSGSGRDRCLTCHNYHVR